MSIKSIIKNKFQIILVSFAVALMGCVCTASPSTNVAQTQVKQRTQEEQKAFIQNLENRTVALIGLNDMGSVKPYCSGVWLNESSILTAAHCIKDPSLVLYASKEDFNSEELKAALVIKISEKDDLALLFAPLGGGKSRSIPLKISHDPWLGQKLHILGHPVGMWWTYTPGVVGSTVMRQFDEDKTPAFQVSSAAWFGNSGGGAFDDDGNLIGICSWLNSAGPNLTFFVPPSAIREFIKEVVSLEN